jgi:two-component system, cell cycle sensor histidine kinase and response regulator CckA
VDLPGGEHVTDRPPSESPHADLLSQNPAEQQRRAEALVIIGRFAGGIAHDFNNVLTVVLSYASALLDEYAFDEQGKAAIEEVRQAAQRGVSYGRKLRGIGLPEGRDVQLLDLSDVVMDAEAQLRAAVGSQVQFQSKVALDLVRCRLDRGEIDRALAHLVNNARDAMPAGGVLTIETRNVVFDEARARLHPGTLPGPYAMLSVSDTGTGIDDATLPRIFEPFFTTSPLRDRLGLGLATVDCVVSRSGGSIAVATAVGQGTTFELYFPAALGELPVRSEP